MDMHNTHYKSGFSLLELILYIAIFSMFIVAVLTISSRSLASKTKALTIQEVEHSARFSIQRITTDVRTATDIDETDFASNQITLTMPNGDVVEYVITSGQLTRDVNSAGAVTLTSNETVTTLTLEDRTAIGSEITDMVITVDTTSATTNPSPQYSADASLSTAISIRQ